MKVSVTAACVAVAGKLSVEAPQAPLSVVPGCIPGPETTAPFNAALQVPIVIAVDPFVVLQGLVTVITGGTLLAVQPAFGTRVVAPIKVPVQGRDCACAFRDTPKETAMTVRCRRVRIMALSSGWRSSRSVNGMASNSEETNDSVKSSLAWSRPLPQVTNVTKRGGWEQPNRRAHKVL